MKSYNGDVVGYGGGITFSLWGCLKGKCFTMVTTYNVLCKFISYKVIKVHDFIISCPGIIPNPVAVALLITTDLFNNWYNVSLNVYIKEIFWEHSYEL